jgi:uncharacterized protein
MKSTNQPAMPIWFTKRQAEYEAELRHYWGKGADGAHDIAHIRRVLKNCLEITSQEAEAPDLEVLLPAAIFHDLVNLPKNSPLRSLASRHSGEAAASILRTKGFAQEKLSDVAHAIAAHSFSADITPTTLEARILQDADRLDALGAVGLARTMYVAGSLGKELYHQDDPLGNTRQLDDVRFALDHFPAKLFTLASTMKTEGGARIALHRTNVLRVFYTQFLDEIVQG